MDTLNERIEKLDLSEADMGMVILNIARTQMQDYERNRHKPNAFAYLSVAETNLINAERQGKDTSQDYERLRRLKAECQKTGF